MPEVFTIGHSNHSLDRFLGLLKMHRIAAVADVRSSPYSAWLPHFNRENLKDAIGKAGLIYVFLGEELGARRAESETYNAEGVAEYTRIAQLPAFHEGINRVIAGAERYRLAIMCAEKDPLECHRTILVARELCRRGIELAHILEDGTIESQEAAEQRLMREEKVPLDDLFESREALASRAYSLRGMKIAYQEDSKDSAINEPK